MILHVIQNTFEHYNKKEFILGILEMKNVALIAKTLLWYVLIKFNLTQQKKTDEMMKYANYLRNRIWRRCLNMVDVDGNSLVNFKLKAYRWA